MTLKFLFNPLTGKFDLVTDSNGAFQRNLTRDLTMRDGESLVVVDYINIGNHTVTLLGDSVIKITS